MFIDKHEVFVTLVILQQICFTYTKTTTITNKEDVKAPLENGERKNPTTSYYRHNLFGPNTYAFGFEVNDKVTGNIQFRDERRYANGSVEGSYGYVRPDGSVMVTHFLADRERGYSSRTQNFEPGDEPKWLENWPTRKPTILMEKPAESVNPTVIYDDNEKLNLTSILLPIEPIKEEHGIDLNPTQLEKELVNPAVLEVINGETPLVGGGDKKDNAIGFETINQFIPTDFPIIPFEIPQEKLIINQSNKEESIEKHKTEPKNKYNTQKENNAEKVLNLSKESVTTPKIEKYVKSKENNAEKSLPTETLRTSYNNENNEENLKLPKAKSLSIDDNIAWYDKVIKQTRQEYLENLK